MNDDQIEDPEDQVRAQLAEMTQDHADLDAAVQALTHVPVPDMMLIGRLKRKKLLLKDQIQQLKEQLTPDIIA